MLDWTGTLFIATIGACVAVLAFGIGRAAVVRPQIGNYLFGFLLAPGLFLVIVLFPVYDHVQKPVLWIHWLVAYIGFGIAFSLPADWPSRTIKIAAFAAMLSLSLAYLYLDDAWVTRGFAQSANRVSHWELVRFAEFVEAEDVGKLSGSIWADEHPNPNVGELAKHIGPPPRYSLAPQWHTWFTGLYRYRETAQRIRITPVGDRLRFDLVGELP